MSRIICRDGVVARVRVGVEEPAAVEATEVEAEEHLAQPVNGWPRAHLVEGTPADVFGDEHLDRGAHHAGDDDVGVVREERAGQALAVGLEGVVALLEERGLRLRDVAADAAGDERLGDRGTHLRDAVWR
ncbi:MAG TPA: hypothetical protein VFS43_17690 [Polyangiaceae bacterium]|nr:hypothetical protein [Polyangiaceae bacterium]